MKQTILAALLLVAAPAHAQVQHAAPQALAAVHNGLFIGPAWYPEQWPESAWAEDLRLMKAHGANVVRIGEYAWSRMEPEEGKYDMDWLVRAVRLADKYGIKVVVGAPTDTPPAWLTQNYPDTLQVDGTGKRQGHGGRRQFSIYSARYRTFARDIVHRKAAAQTEA